MKAVGKYIVIKELHEVLNPGSDVTLLNKGDKIYYDRHAGFNIEIKDKMFKVIKEQDIVIII